LDQLVRSGPFVELRRLNLIDLVAMQNVAYGPKRHLVRRGDLVALGVKPDMVRPSQIGR
jgi:hypothetical protein